ncbi:hypothetical protein [Micromonospora tarensis]|uniref:hypothetical protein n=1 Tax=Micromonospora tarensis TaxID=2806100 RepID=UPI002816683D|nr:hypothetical protein [Micromonospora tarensis]
MAAATGVAARWASGSQSGVARPGTCTGRQPSRAGPAGARRVPTATPGSTTGPFGLACSAVTVASTTNDWSASVGSTVASWSAGSQPG